MRPDLLAISGLMLATTFQFVPALAPARPAATSSANSRSASYANALKTFHDEILSGGALPLDILDARVSRWIKGQVRGASAS